MGVFLGRAQDEVSKKGVPRVVASAAAGLKNDRRVRFVRSAHHGLNIFEIVHVECRQGIAIFCGMIE